jgi:hypothetical protein
LWRAPKTTKQIIQWHSQSTSLCTYNCTLQTSFEIIDIFVDSLYMLMNILCSQLSGCLFCFFFSHVALLGRKEWINKYKKNYTCDKVSERSTGARSRAMTHRVREKQLIKYIHERNVRRNFYLRHKIFIFCFSLFHISHTSVEPC